jgi:hypothetical protein
MLENIQLVDDSKGLLLLRPCLELMMFSDVSLAEGAESYLLSCQAIHSFIGKELRFYITNDMKRGRSLTCTPQEQIRLVLSDKKAVSSTFFVVEQHAGNSQDDYALPSFTLFSEREKISAKKIRDHVLFRICIHPDQYGIVPGMLLETLKSFPLSSGYCMFSYYYNVGNIACIEHVERHNASWLKRFPGLSHGNPLQLLMYGNDGLLQVGWLTMLGGQFGGSTGALADCLGILPSKAEVVEVSGTKRLFIKAGSQPELGDRNRRDMLATYAGVGKALARLRLPDSLLGEMSLDGLEDEDAREWVLRFFGDETA